MEFDQSVADEVRHAFLDAGFTADGLLAALGPSAYAALGRGEPVPARRALADRSDPQAVLTRLFVLGEPVSTMEAMSHLPVDALRHLGLVRGEQSLQAALDVRPYGEPDTDWYVVSDHGPDSAGRAPAEVAADHVLGVGGASLTLARITPRTPVKRALDLGTGCGVQALHLARHARDVVATDVTARAVRLAGLTAALSGQVWDLRTGSLTDPVADDEFDLIVTNPPFVISGTARYAYRDAGLPGDELGRLLTMSLPRHLAEGGTAVLLANWLHLRDQDWQERVAEWVADSGCDAWVAQREVQDPAEYVGLWLRDAGLPQVQPGGPDLEGPSETERRYDAWLATLEGWGAEAIGFGWIVLHRGGTFGRGGPRIEDVCDAVRLPRGDEVTALVSARGEWAQVDAFGLLSARPRRMPGTRLSRQETTTDEGHLLALPALVGDAQGWRRDRLIDDVTESLLRSLDGSVSLLVAAQATAQEHGLDLDEVLPGVLMLTRALVEEGVLALT